MNALLSQFKPYEKIYFKNLQVLQEKHSPLVPLLSCPFFSEKVEAFNTKDGLPTLSLDGRLLHSRRHPLREADKFCESNRIRPDDFIILYGYGLGYHVHAISRLLGEGGFLYVVECNHDILRAAFMLVDQTEVMSQDNVFIITGADDRDVALRLDNEVFWAFENIEDERKKVLFFNPSLELIPRRFSRINDVFELFSFQRRARYSLGEKMISNLQRNIPGLLEACSVSSLFGKFADVPGFLVGAGPGLDKTIHFLDKFREKAVIFAVDSACQPLYSRGIIPDFVVCVDPKDETILNFQDIAELSNLIVLPTVCADVLDLKKSRLFTAVQEKSLVQDICGTLLDSKGLTQAGGSVSCIMFDLAAKMGVNPVLLAGMDYGFPGWKSYAVMTPEYKKLASSISRFNSMETMSYNFIRSQKVMYLENTSGIPIPTYQSLYSYARGMEQLIKQHDDTAVYNLFSDGVYLEGTKSMFFEEELDELLKENVDKENIISQAKSDDLTEDDKKALLAVAKMDPSQIKW
ncbi:MAG: motility associated factor glycosyltransferase family protein [Candidatus Aureabacteria bacterium]|nr:motility associated factor glycosyltransferase family protein [Candidatus Auribacterota bacterium]